MADSPFVIQWQITEEEWTRAAREMAEQGPGSEYDRNALALYYLLNGELDFIAGGIRMFADSNGGRGARMSVLDVATGLASPFMDGAFLSKDVVAFEELDDNLRILFAMEAGVVRLQSNRRSHELTVAKPAFMEGLLVFLCSFGKACELRIPEALRWESLRSLKAVLSEHCSKAHVNGS